MADSEKVAKLEQELAALKLKISQQPKVTTKFVTPSSKLRRFDGEGDLEQWISESERILRQRGLEGPEAADEKSSIFLVQLMRRLGGRKKPLLRKCMNY